MPRRRLPKLPRLLERKIYKTGQTRGADDDEIFQNRVSRTSTVLIPYPVWVRHFTRAAAQQIYEKGYIVLISPTDYFGHLQHSNELGDQGLALGENALVFYETRAQWIANNPDALGWQPAENRLDPLGGQYVARISATTAIEAGAKIIRGFDTTANKGAGIRVYEYAGESVIMQCRNQLEALFWLCADASAVAANNGMTDAELRKGEILKVCEESGLLDRARLTEARILNRNERTICPLCLMELSSQGFFTRVEQAAGREVLDQTITQINLFHIEELRTGVFNHRPYNVGWGHHHCNVVVNDAGIRETLQWMNVVLQRNIDGGHFPAANKGN
jgi:hypothetical protein